MENFFKKYTFILLAFPSEKKKQEHQTRAVACNIDSSMRSYNSWLKIKGSSLFFLPLVLFMRPPVFPQEVKSLQEKKSHITTWALVSQSLREDGRGFEFETPAK